MKTQPRQTMTKQAAVLLREFNGKPMISSLMMADMTGKSHGNVIKNIESTFKEHSIDEKDFISTYIDKSNRKAKHYLLPKTEFELVVNRYSAKHKAKLLSELGEYEANKKNLPSTTEDNQEGTSQLQIGKVLTLEEATSIKEINGEPVMSSLRISEVTNKQHKHVIRDIEVIFKELGIGDSKFEVSYLSPQNKPLKAYLLPEMEFNLVASGYSVKYRFELMKELMSYRKKEVTPKIPTSKELLAMSTETLKALAAQMEANQEALEVIKEKEKVIEKKDEIIINIADLNIKSGEVQIGDFAKNLNIDGLGRNSIFKWLKEHKYLMRNNKPYQTYVNRGYFTLRPSAEKINGRYRYTTYLTPRGTIWLTTLLKDSFKKE